MMNVKRLFDILAAIVMLVVLSPIFAVTAAMIYLNIGKPVLFRQIRPGKDGQLFEIYKFRTMHERRDERGELLPDEERTGKLGLFLRRSSIDELPQLFNVLKGDMSLIGPRPLLPEYLALYTPEQARRHAMRPGITGWAQVNGRNLVSWEDKFAFDVWYIDHWSLALDIKIFRLTLLKIFRREGIGRDGKVGGGEPFKGSK